MFMLHSSIAKLVIVQLQHCTNIRDIKRPTRCPITIETVYLLPDPITSQGICGTA